MLTFCGTSLSAVFIVFLLATFTNSKGTGSQARWQYLDVVIGSLEAAHSLSLTQMRQIYAFGNVKLLITVFKYVPQAWLNHRRKSTSGWAIEGILLDLTGACLSIVQLFIDASQSSDWSGVIGNPAKFALGNMTIIFDVIFMVQHYILYRHQPHVARTHTDGDAGEQSPLLSAAPRSLASATA